MTEGQIIELARALRRAGGDTLSWSDALGAARYVLLHDTTWQDPSACSL